MIQDIYPHKLHNEYKPDAKADLGSPVLCFNNGVLGRLSEKEDGTIVFPTFEEITAAGCPADKIVFAFTLDDTDYYLDISENQYTFDNFEYLNLHTIRQKVDHIYGMIMYTGVHLYQWYDVSRYCGKCSAPTVHSETERALKCTCCGKTIYPRIMPAVIVGVTNGDKLLVTKYKLGFAHFALIAGFTEIGETLEETVAREVMEEAGLKVKNIRYAGSQPWGLAQDILAGFYCDVDGDTEIHMDANELKLAEWRSREDLILQPDDFSLTNDMMKRFKENKDK